MNTFCRKRSFVWTILATSIVGYGNVCLSKDQEPIAMLDKQVSQLEGLWEAGKTQEYYAEAASIANHIMVDSTSGNINRVAARLLESLLSKAAQLPKTSPDDLFVMQKVASYLVTNANASTEEQRTNVRLVSRFLGEIRKEIIPNFKRKSVTLNVSPPPGVAGMAGMDPEAIRDPIARAKYKAAIRENQSNNLLNTRQTVLRNIEREVSEPIVRYMIATFQAWDGGSSALVAECIKNARLTDEEREEVESKIGSASRMGDKQ